MLGYARVLNTSRGDLYENPLRGGEVCKLKSGGPVMVVGRVTEEGEVEVWWFDKVGVMHTDKFALELLQRARRSFFVRWR